MPSTRNYRLSGEDVASLRAIVSKLEMEAQSVGDLLFVIDIKRILLLRIAEFEAESEMTSNIRKSLCFITLVQDSHFCELNG